MSGGEWNYVGGRIDNDLQMLSEDPQIQGRWPRLAHLLSHLGSAIRVAEHEMDWDVCSDKAISDDAAFERRVIGEVLEAAMRAAPDEWFPRGKWATIQALQEMRDS